MSCELEKTALGLWATGFENKLRTYPYLSILTMNFHTSCVFCRSVGAGGDLCEHLENLDDCQTPRSSLPSWMSQASQKILILLTPNQGFGDQVRSSLDNQLWSATDSFKCFNCDPGSWVTLWEPLVAAYYSYDANIFRLYRAIGWWNLPKLGIASIWKRVQSREKPTYSIKFAGLANILLKAEFSCKSALLWNLSAGPVQLRVAESLPVWRFFSRFFICVKHPQMLWCWAKSF